VHAERETAVKDPGVSVGHSVFQHTREATVTDRSQQETAFKKIRTIFCISGTRIANPFFVSFDANLQLEDASHTDSWCCIPLGLKYLSVLQ